MSLLQAPTPLATTGQRLLLRDITWSNYTRMLRALDEHPNLRMTYDRGALEIMTLSFEHETDGDFLGQVVRILTEELGLPIKGSRSTTMRRKRQRRGLEPDNCYWIAHEPEVRGKKRLDLRVDPPPDLAIEVEISRSVLKRMGIYAALGVPEVWRYDGPTLTCHWLGADGQYVVSEYSRCFSGFRVGEALRFLAMRGQMDENAVVAAFRSWVRSQIAAGWPATPR